MGAFIWSIDHKTWKSIITRWEAPKKALQDGVTLVKKTEIDGVIQKTRPPYLIPRLSMSSIMVLTRMFSG